MCMVAKCLKQLLKLAGQHLAKQSANICLESIHIVLVHWTHGRVACGNCLQRIRSLFERERRRAIIFAIALNTEHPSPWFVRVNVLCYCLPSRRRCANVFTMTTRVVH